jgi:hypothetical protein
MLCRTGPIKPSMMMFPVVPLQPFRPAFIELVQLSVRLNDLPLAFLINLAVLAMPMII